MAGGLMRIDEVCIKRPREKSLWKQPKSRESPAEVGDHEIMISKKKKRNYDDINLIRLSVVHMQPQRRHIISLTQSWIFTSSGES